MSVSFTRECSICGRQFQPRHPSHDKCPACFRSSGGSGRPQDHGGSSSRRQDFGGRRGGPADRLPDEFKLDNFYTEAGAIRREVYLDVSEEIAKIFSQAELTAASLRRFFESVRAAYEHYLQDPDRSFDKAMERVYRLRPLARKSEERQITKPCFTDFMEHYIELTSKDPKNLKGFKELFMSVIGYMKK